MIQQKPVRVNRYYNRFLLIFTLVNGLSAFFLLIPFFDSGTGGMWQRAWNGLHNISSICLISAIPIHLILCRGWFTGIIRQFSSRLTGKSDRVNPKCVRSLLFITFISILFITTAISGFNLHFHMAHAAPVDESSLSLLTTIHTAGGIATIVFCLVHCGMHRRKVKSAISPSHSAASID